LSAGRIILCDIGVAFAVAGVGKTCMLLDIKGAVLRGVVEAPELAIAAVATGVMLLRADEELLEDEAGALADCACSFANFA
jgi:hypothetical protein